MSWLATLLVVSSSILNVLANIEFITIEGNQFFTSTETSVDLNSGNTLVNVYVPPNPSWMMATTTYVEVLIGPTFTVTESFMEDVPATLTTEANTYLPTAPGDQGSLDYCVKDQMGNGECIQEIWTSGVLATMTTTFSVFNGRPTLSTYYINISPTAAGTTSISTSKHRKVIGAAVGGVLGGVICIAIACLLLVRKNNIRKAEASRRRRNSTMARLGVLPGRDGQTPRSPYVFSVPAGGYVDSKVNLPKTEDGYGADAKEQVSV